MPAQEGPATAQGTSEAQPAGPPAPAEVAPLPGPGPSEGPEAAAAENVEVELAGCWAPGSLSTVRPLRVARRPERLGGALHVRAEDLRVQGG